MICDEAIFPNLSLRFLPYPHPAHPQRHIDSSNASAGAPTDVTSSLSAAEFQLRKVNSEPNLKMRIRARLLNKGSSPHQQQANSAVFLPQQPHIQQQSQQRFKFKKKLIKQIKIENFRPESNGATAGGNLLDSSAIQQRPTLDAALLLQQAAHQALTGQQLTAAVASSNMMVPSPSLPNLPTGTLGGIGPGGGKIGSDGVAGSTFGTGSQQDLVNLMNLQNIMHFLSMPSLLKTQLLPTTSMFDPPQSMADSSSSSSTSSG
jgi:hypothetical protein